MRRFVGVSPIAISAVPLQRARESEKLDVSANSMIWSELEFEFRRRSVGEIATKVAIVCDHWLAVDADFAGQPNGCSRQSIGIETRRSSSERGSDSGRVIRFSIDCGLS